MSEFSAQELSELRMKRLEQEAVDAKVWPKDERITELVYQPRAVRESLKRDLMNKTTVVKSALP